MTKPRRGLQESKSARYKTAAAPADAFAPSPSNIDAVLDAAARMGLLKDKGTRISGRVSPALVKQAKRMTGIDSDTRLIEFALATIALEDPFPRAFVESRGKLDPTLKLDIFDY